MEPQFMTEKILASGLTEAQLDYMLHKILFYNPQEQRMSSALRIFHVVTSVCSYFKILSKLQNYSIIIYADVC